MTTQPMPPDIARRLQTLGFAPTWEGYQQWLSRDSSKTGPNDNIIIKPGTGPGDGGDSRMDVPPVYPPSSGGGPTIYPPSTGGGGSSGGGSGGGGSYPPSGGGSSGGSSTTTSTGGGSTMTPYIKSVTSNTSGNNNSALLQQLIAALSKSSAGANTAGEAQYQNLLNAMKLGSKQTMGYYKQAGQQIANFGASQKDEIEQTRLNQRAEVNQDMIGRGLGNTTILPTMLGGADTRATKANIALGDTIAGMKSGLLERTGGMKFDLTKLKGDSILSRQNVGPDMGMYLNLIQMLGASGGTSKNSPVMMR